MNSFPQLQITRLLLIFHCCIYLFYSESMNAFLFYETEETKFSDKQPTTASRCSYPDCNQTKELETYNLCHKEFGHLHISNHYNDLHE